MKSIGVPSLLVTLALIVGTTFGRKTYLVKEEHKGRIPRVRNTNYPSYTYYENFDDEITIYYQAAIAAAWEWDQTMEEDQNGYPDIYHLKWKLFFKQSLYFKPLLSFPRAIYLEPEFQVQEFEFGFLFDTAYIYGLTGSAASTRIDYLCFSSMMNLSEILTTATLVMRFQECYKTLVNCIYNLQNFNGIDAKYFEECSQSSKTSITMLERTRAESNQDFFGSDDDDVLRTGTGCIERTPTFIGDLQTSLVSNLLSYVKQTYDFKNGEVQLINAQNLPEEQ